MVVCWLSEMMFVLYVISGFVVGYLLLVFVWGCERLLELCSCLFCLQFVLVC